MSIRNCSIQKQGYCNTFQTDKSKLPKRNTMVFVGFMAVFRLIFSLIVVPLGLFIGRKLYLTVKEEEHKEKGKVIQTLTKNYVVIQCVAWPGILGMYMVFKATSSPHIIALLRFFYILTFTYVGLNSLLIATCRYIFIVIIQHNDALTIKKIRTCILRISIFLPALLAVIQELTVPRQKRWVDRLKEMTGPNNTQLPEYDTPNKSTNISGNFSSNTTMSDFQSPMFNLFDEYVPSDIKFGIGVVFIILKLAIFSNIIEGCLYAHIYIKNRQSEKNGIVNINELLSEEAKIKRNRRKTINIQITFISWLVEFVAGIIGLLQVLLRHVSSSILSLSVFLNFIIIPGIYLLNTEMCKPLIITQGWWKWIRTLLCSNPAAPPQNAEQEVNGIPNASSISNVAGSTKTEKEFKSKIRNMQPSNRKLEPIPTISGSIDRYEQTRLKPLQNNYM